MSQRDPERATLATIDLLAAAATAMPWPAEQIEERLVEHAAAVCGGARVTVEPVPAPPPDLSVLFSGVHGDARYLVAHRPVGTTALTDQQRRVVVALASMATASRHAAVREGRLRRRARTDDLTGLWGHAFFLEMLATLSISRDHTEHLGVLYLDLDHFKQVNESLGHVDADEVLRTIGTRLAALADDGLVAGRLGGDEFGVVARGVTDAAHLEQIAERVREVVAEPVPVAEMLVRVGVSVGSVLSTTPQDDPERLLRAADQALRRAKRARDAESGNPQWYDERTVLRDVLDHQGVGVAYQPIVDLGSGQVHGYEALVRAHHLDVGRLPPLVLVDSASRLRLLDELTGTVLDQALGTLAQVADRAAAEVVLSVNVEHEQLRRGSALLEGLPDRLRGTGVRLVLELSERSVGRWTAEKDLAARTLAAGGVGLAVDDFGAGYATFAMLSSWPWEWVKIDRALVSGHDDEQGRRLLGHIARMLGDLDAVAVAEGVESAEQLELVRGLGVDLAQGRHLCPPVPAEQVLETVAAHGLRLP